MTNTIYIRNVSYNELKKCLTNGWLYTDFGDKTEKTELQMEYKEQEADINLLIPGEILQAHR